MMKMKLRDKSEWFELPSPIGEPDYDWEKFNGSQDHYPIERIVRKDGEVVWFGIGTNWKKKPNEGWTKLTKNENAKPLEKHLPEIIYGEDRNYFAPCDIPIYEKMYLELNT